MTPSAPHPRQALIVSWLAQMVGTLVIAGVVLAFVRAVGAPFGGQEYAWQRYIMGAILLATVPAALYVKRFKAYLDADEAAVAAGGGTPDAQRRQRLIKSLAVGGALCELPMAVGVLHLFLGGETRWFVGATLITLALRLSYRPFTRMGR